MKLWVYEELKNHQEALARAVMAKMPGKKFYGNYYCSWYAYPSICIGYKSRQYHSWTNYEPASFLSSYKEAELSDFNWHPLVDDTLILQP